MPATDDFYIGYLPRAPKGLARILVRAVIALTSLGLAISFVLALGQQPFPRAVFEFQQYRDFAGVIEANPYPALLVDRPGMASGQPAFSRYLLVDPGKHGADSSVRGFAGKQVSLRGSLIYRDGQTMIELVPGTLALRSETPGRPITATELGQVSVVGEIVDSKCFLGVMNPGRTKVHRDCAARCISGGIPPMLVTSEAAYLLVGTDGRALNREVLDMVGETITVRGIAARSGETLTIKAEPRTYERVTAASRSRKSFLDASKSGSVPKPNEMKLANLAKPTTTTASRICSSVKP